MSLITCTEQCTHQKDGLCALDVATKIDQACADLECAYFSNDIKHSGGTEASVSKESHVQ